MKGPLDVLNALEADCEKRGINLNEMELSGRTRSEEARHHERRSDNM